MPRQPPPRLYSLLAVTFFAVTPALFAQADRPSARQLKDYGQLPLSFEANQGHADPQIKFLSRGNRYGLFFTGDAAILTLPVPDSQKKDTGTRAPGVAERAPKVSQLAPRYSQGSRARGITDTIRLQLNHASRTISVSGTDPLPGTPNYFAGRNPANWHTNIPTYAKVEYKSVYPGIDLVYYGNRRQLEYDFIIAPGASPKPIALQASKNFPVSSNAPQKLNHGYPGCNAFVTKLNPTLSALVYSTYLGGTVTPHETIAMCDQGTGIAVDTAGEAFVTGLADSPNFPVTTGAFQRTNLTSPTVAMPSQQS